jgi:hypothetical protein
VFTNVKEPSTQGSDRAKVFLAIRLLIDADALPAILLVIQLFSVAPSAVAIRCAGAPCFFFEKGNVFVFELNGLFCIISTPFHSILTDSEEVIKGYQ